MTKEQILGALPKLSRSDLEAVQAMATHLLAGRVSNVAAPANPLAQSVFDALVAALGLTNAYASYSPTSQRQFEKKLPDLIKFLDENFKGWDGSKISQLAFLTMLFSLLADDLKNKGVASTIGILITNMPRLPQVFDNAFPGYRVAGATDAILKRFKKDSK